MSNISPLKIGWAIGAFENLWHENQNEALQLLHTLGLEESEIIEFLNMIDVYGAKIDEFNFIREINITGQPFRKLSKNKRKELSLKLLSRYEYILGANGAPFE